MNCHERKENERKGEEKYLEALTILVNTLLPINFIQKTKNIILIEIYFFSSIYPPLFSTFLQSFFTMANISFLFSGPGYVFLIDLPNSLTLT